MPHINIQYFNSSCGLFVLASFGDKLCLCDWSNNPCAERNKRRIERYLNASFKIETTSVLEEAKRQLDGYFAGNRKAFTIPLHLVGTDFHCCPVKIVKYHLSSNSRNSVLDIQALI